MGLQKIVGCLHQGEKRIYIPPGYGDCSNCPDKKCVGYIPVVTYVFYVFSREEIETFKKEQKGKYFGKKY